MRILSLFDGISCGRVALERVGVKVSTYYASEIDKYSIQIAMKNYPGTIQLGDINNFTGATWRAFPDLIIGGSPCQGFSFAGKQLAFADSRSALFFKFVEILTYYRPKYFLLENVRMKKEHRDIITKYLGVEPICINSSLVSAQNRIRYYWTNIPSITQPRNKHIFLEHIIDKTTFVAPYGTYTNNLADNIKGFENRRRIRHPHQKSNSLLAASGGHSEPKISVGEHYYRKLTPLECERLQTLPDNYTEGVSNTQRYKMLGNGWTVDVLAHIFKGLL